MKFHLKFTREMYKKCVNRKSIFFDYKYIILSLVYDDFIC